MINIFLILFYLLIGIGFQYVKWFPVNIYKLLNKVVIYICLPFLTLYYIPKIHWNPSLLYPTAVSWIGFIIAFVVFGLLGTKLGWSKKLIGCLIITAGLGNTSFLGFPITKALYGEEGLKTAILVDQLGTFIVLSTLAVFVATICSKETVNGIKTVKKILLFPPFLSFLFAVMMNILDFDFHHYAQLLFKSIGSLITPLALFSVGLQLRFEIKSKHWKFLWLGLIYKLMITPAIIFILYVVILGQNSIMIHASVLEAAMAPMISASILAATHGLKPRLCSMMIGFGIPISFLALIFWYFLLQLV